MRDEHRTHGAHAANFRTLTITTTTTTGSPVVTRYPGMLEALTAWRRLTGTTTARPRWGRRDRPKAALALAARRRNPQPRWRWNGESE